MIIITRFHSIFSKPYLKFYNVSFCTWVTVFSKKPKKLVLQYQKKIIIAAQYKQKHPNKINYLKVPVNRQKTIGKKPRYFMQFYLQPEIRLLAKDCRSAVIAMQLLPCSYWHELLLFALLHDTLLLLRIAAPPTLPWGQEMTSVSLSTVKRVRHVPSWISSLVISC